MSKLYGLKSLVIGLENCLGEVVVVWRWHWGASFTMVISSSSVVAVVEVTHRVIARTLLASSIFFCLSCSCSIFLFSFLFLSLAFCSFSLAFSVDSCFFFFLIKKCL